jgi:hypothetical protein
LDGVFRLCHHIKKRPRAGVAFGLGRSNLD